MANSKLLKEAIADAKAVKETALANAKLALEEAFTPRLQSILSQKLQAEAEAEKDDDMQNEELDSSNIGSKVDAGYAETPGAQPNYDADTDLSVGVKKDSGKPEQAGTDYKKVADISEEEMPDMGGEKSKEDEIAELKARLAELESGVAYEGDDMADDDMGGDDMGSDDMGGDDDQFGGDDDQSDDDMDLEAIIRELEAQLEGEGAQEEPADDENPMAEIYHDGEEAGTDKSEDPAVKVANEQEDVTKATVKGKVGAFDNKQVSEDVIDLEEILREMEDDMKGDDEDKKDEAIKAELNEAYETIKSLQKTINEVNLLNAKLLFANKLFRAHNMTNEQKVKVIETLDRTKSVREVKLVYSTLAENFKYTSSNKVAKKSITEGIASKVVKSTAPKAEVKQVIAESTDFADRFKKLAGIIK